MLSNDMIMGRKPLMSIWALSTKFLANLGYLSDNSLMPLGDVVLIIRFSVFPSHLGNHFLSKFKPISDKAFETNPPLLDFEDVRI
jgi:hypothetical protein